MVTMSLNLGAVVAMAVFGILRLQRLFHLFILLCWILTVLCWIFFGLYLFLNNFSSDTCKALEMFQENPNNNNLSSILLCEQLQTAKSVLTMYPAHPFADGRWMFPEIVEFHCYDKYMELSLNK